jgi:hypothetical protein
LRRSRASSLLGFSALMIHLLISWSYHTQKLGKDKRKKAEKR